jgi:predicted ATP-dependent protease
MPAGIREKLQAAHRCGLRRVIIPRANERDLRDLPASVSSALEVVLASSVHDVLRAAFDPCDWPIGTASPEGPSSSLSPAESAVLSEADAVAEWILRSAL